MLKFLKVTGESLSPFFQEGDFVLVGKIPYILRSIKKGDVLVFHHPTYGVLIKKVESVASDGSDFFVMGTHPDSLDSRQIGSLPRSFLVGKVIWHIRKPSLPVV
jgi:nickel-type superoxide dismutase maturation protease